MFLWEKGDVSAVSVYGKRYQGPEIFILTGVMGASKETLFQVLIFFA
jgi:hypothetical protein